ncbi:MAG: hypothetical protein H7330_10480 [Hymenobacteraceae bacterium]|nr:hypothetical protein [Hymenobacteraceae bacterium]
MVLADYLSPAFLEDLLSRHQPGRDLRVRAVTPLALDSSASILATLAAAGQQTTPVGHFGLNVTVSAAGAPPTMHPLVLKLKPSGAVVSAMLGQLAAHSGGVLADVYPALLLRAGFAHTHTRELAVYGAYGTDPLLPRVWGLHADDARGHYAILLEYLDETADISLLNSVATPERWTDEHLRTALRQLAGWHARHLGRPLPRTPTEQADEPSRAYMLALTPLWEALIASAAHHAPTVYSPARAATLRRFVGELPDYWSELEVASKTLIHNDLNPRNTCFRATAAGPRLCAYDWELATHHVPPYDVVELLSFVLTPDRYHQRLPLLELYRHELHTLTGQYADPDAFRRLTALAARDFGLHRLGMYLMAHAVSPYPFLPRVVDSYFDTIQQLGEA